MWCKGFFCVREVYTFYFNKHLVGIYWEIVVHGGPPKNWFGKNKNNTISADEVTKHREIKQLLQATHPGRGGIGIQMQAPCPCVSAFPSEAASLTVH